jgi:hypothetical protein
MDDMNFSGAGPWEKPDDSENWELTGRGFHIVGMPDEAAIWTGDAWAQP